MDLVGVYGLLANYPYVWVLTPSEGQEPLCLPPGQEGLGALFYLWITHWCMRTDQTRSGTAVSLRVTIMSGGGSLGGW